MSNFRFIDMNAPIAPILQQVLDRPQDWDEVSTYAQTGGDKNPYGFLPMTMAVVEPGADAKNAEGLRNTPLRQNYDRIYHYLSQHSIRAHSRAAFFRLKPGHSVGWHIDEGTYYLTQDRSHLSLQGHYRYTVGDESHIIKPGTFFWFDNKKKHTALNVDDVDRITFVFDVPHSPSNP